MASIRRVTRKPPKILIDAIKTPAAERMVISVDVDPIWINAPKMMIEEIALVTAISGVCSECATVQITWKPMNTVAVDEGQAQTLLKLMDVLDDNDDVQQVSANFEIPDDIMAKLTA